MISLDGREGLFLPMQFCMLCNHHYAGMFHVKEEDLLANKLI